MRAIQAVSKMLMVGILIAGISALGQTAATPKANSPEAQEVLKVIQRFQEAGVKGDTATLMQIFDPDVTHFHPGSPYRFIGAERLAK